MFDIVLTDGCRPLRELAAGPGIKSYNKRFLQFRLVDVFAEAVVLYVRM